MKSGLVFEVTSSVAYEKLISYFSNNYLPVSTVQSLEALKSSIKSFPTFISLSGLKFQLIGSESVDIKCICVVRTREVIVKSETSVSVMKETIDIYPKFKLAKWNSGKVNFYFNSVRILDSFLAQLGVKQERVEHFESILSENGSILLSVKGGNITVAKKGETYNVVDVTKDFVFDSPIECL